MRLPRLRPTVRMMMAVVALTGLALGVWRLGERSAFYRKQAALCAYFERQCQWYAKDWLADRDKDLPLEARQESARLSRAEAERYARLRTIYARIARRPWESLPANAPPSVNPWDLGRLSAAEIEQMVQEWDND